MYYSSCLICVLYYYQAFQTCSLASQTIHAWVSTSLKISFIRIPKKMLEWLCNAIIKKCQCLSLIIVLRILKTNCFCIELKCISSFIQLLNLHDRTYSLSWCGLLAISYIAIPTGKKNTPVYLTGEICVTWQSMCKDLGCISELPAQG